MPSTSTASRPPPALCAAALLAFIAIYVTGERFVGMPIMAILLLASYVTPFRFSAGRGAGGAVRLVCFAAIIALTGMPQRDYALWYMEPQYTNLIGFMLSAELVLRIWRRAGAGGLGDSPGLILFLTALIMACASNTYNRQPMRTLGPIYAVLVALSLRSIIRPAQLMQGTPVRRRLLPTLLALRGIALAIALAMGFGVVLMLSRYDNRLAAWAMELLRQEKQPHTSSIGLHGAPRLRKVFNPEPSMERVLLIDGSRAERHIRVMAFDEYRDRQWNPPINQRDFRPVGSRFLLGRASGTPLRIIRLGELTEVLPFPSDAVAIDPPAPLEMDELGALRERDPESVAYTVRVQSGAGGGMLLLPPSERGRARDLVVPSSIDPRVLELARRTAGQGSDDIKIARLAVYLRSHHAYSLSYDPGDGEPLNDFLLHDRAAHCQYFASAMVILARAAGVPARMATGYYAHEASGGNQMVVRDRDAHAWAECFIQGRGWITVDATPAAGLPDVIFPPPSKWRTAWEWFTDLPRRLRQWLARASGAAMLAAALFFASVPALWWAFKKLFRRPRAPGVSDDYLSPSRELAELARRFERWLARRGVVCSPHRTWREHLSDSPELSAVCAAGLGFANAYDVARFGAFDPSSIAQLAAQLNQLEHQPISHRSTHHG